MVDSRLLGSFVYESSTNCGEYAQAAGITIDLEKEQMGSDSPTELTVTVSADGEWSFIYSGIENRTATFRLGEES